MIFGTCLAHTLLVYPFLDGRLALHHYVADSGTRHLGMVCVVGVPGALGGVVVHIGGSY